MIRRNQAFRVFATCAALCSLAFSGTARASCGDGVIEMGEGCDDGGMAPGDGCSAGCTVEAGWGCVPSLFATGVNDAGAALPMGAVDPHWTWSQINTPSLGVPAIATRNSAWPIHAPGQWVAPSVNFGNELTTGVETFWFQEVNIPAGFAGALSFPIVVSCDNSCEVSVNGTQYGMTHSSFLTTGSVTIPASAFVVGANQVTVRLVEGTPGTPRGILIYPGGGGILSQCTEQCTNDSECDDMNDCTVDTCLLSACTNAPAALGTLCSGGACNGSLITPACETCVNSSPMGTDGGCTMTDPHCRTTGNGAPQCEPCLDTDMGSGSDLGCSSGAPYCVSGAGGNSCVQCLSGTDCSDGNSCSQDVCTAGVCSNPPASAGTLCSGGLCNGSNLVCELCIDTGNGTDSGCTAGTPNCIGASGSRTCVECISAAGCNDGDVCTQDVCTAGTCSNPPAAAGTTCPGGVCDGLGSALCEACVDSGSGTDLGCGAATPHCIGASGSRTCVECTTALHCDDSVDCTDDACTGNACVNTSVAAGDAGECASSLVCSGGPSDTCVTCADTDSGAGTDAGCASGAPFCAPVGGGAGATCEVCVDSGAANDPGCDPSTPNCVVGAGGANECVSCTSGADCSDGNACTTDVCTAGMCANPAVAEFTDCSTGVCTAAAMCAAVQVTITAPVDQSVSNNNVPTLTGTGTPGATIELSLNMGGPLTTTVDASGNWSLTLSSPLDDGGYGLLAIINVALLSDTDMVNFAIDTVTEVVIASPADGGTSLDSSPLIVGTGEPGASVVVSVDGNEIGMVVVASDGSWMLTVPSPLVNGSHTVTAVATDDLGNMDSASSTFSIAADTLVDIDGPADGAVINDNTPTITGTALAGASVTVTTTIGGSVLTLGTAVADGSGVWTLDVSSPLDDATYILAATATDLAGNMAQDSSTFTVDTMTFVTIGDVDPTTGTVTGTGEPGATVVVTIDSVEVGTVVVAVDGTWSFDGDALGVGQHSISATATDPAGNTATATDSLVVSVPDGGVTPDGGMVTGTGGISGGALCATHAPSGSSLPAAAGMLLVGLALVARRRRR